MPQWVRMEDGGMAPLLPHGHIQKHTVHSSASTEHGELTIQPHR